MDKVYKLKIGGNNVEIHKKYRTKTQYEYWLKIFMGDSDWDSLLIYREMWLTKKGAIDEANRAIYNSPPPRIEREF